MFLQDGLRTRRSMKDGLILQSIYGGSIESKSKAEESDKNRSELLQSIMFSSLFLFAANASLYVSQILQQKFGMSVSEIFVVKGARTGKAPRCISSVPHGFDPKLACRIERRSPACRLFSAICQYYYRHHASTSLLTNGHNPPPVRHESQIICQQHQSITHDVTDGIHLQLSIPRPWNSGNVNPNIAWKRFCIVYVIVPR